jgi:hypothetical protein
MENIPDEKESKDIITSTIYCVNTNFAYVYKLLHGEIVSETKIVRKA